MSLPPLPQRLEDRLLFESPTKSLLLDVLDYGAACRAAALDKAAAIVGKLSDSYKQSRDESAEKDNYAEYDVYQCAFKALEDARALILAAKEKR